MTTQEAAEALGLHRSRVLHFIREGRLQADKRGRDWWLEPEEVERFKTLERREGKPRAVYELYYNIGSPRLSQKYIPDKTVVEGKRNLKALLAAARTYTNPWKIVRVSDGKVLYQSK